MFTSMTASFSMTELTAAMQANAMSQAGAAVDAIEIEAERCRNLQAAVDRLRSRSNTVGLPVDAVRLRDALAHEQSIERLFAEDPASLAGNHADAQLLAASLERGGIDVGAQFLYPVLIRSVKGGKSTEYLAWMSEEERRQLDRLPLSQKTEIPGCPTRQENGNEGDLTMYCCLDACATLRLSGSNMAELLERSERSQQASSNALHIMASDFAQSASRNTTVLKELLALLNTASAQLERHLEQLIDERQAMEEEYRYWQLSVQRQHAEQTRDKKHAVRRQEDQREACRGSR